MGRGLQQLGALGERLAHESELEVLEIAQAAMDQLGRGRRRSAGIIPLLGEHHLQPAACGVAGNGGAVNAAADDEDIEHFGGQGVSL